MARINPNAYTIPDPLSTDVIRTYVDSVKDALVDIDANGTYYRGSSYAAGTEGDVLAWRQAQATYVPRPLTGGGATPGTGVQRGINLSGGEFGAHGSFGGSPDQDYFFPKLADFQFWGGKGLTLYRVPWTWERMQPLLNGVLDETYAAQVSAVLNAAETAGVFVLLDCHNYGRRTIETAGGFTADFTSTIGPWTGSNLSVSAGRLISDPGSDFPVMRAGSTLSSATQTFTATARFTSEAGAASMEFHGVAKDGDNYYWLRLDRSASVWAAGKKVGGVSTTLGSGAQVFALNTDYTAIVDANQALAGNVRFTIDGVVKGTYPTDAALTAGRVVIKSDFSKLSIDNTTFNVNGSTTGFGTTANTIGDGTLTPAHLQDLWAKVAARYKAHPAVWGYDVMNEPHDMPVPTSPTTYNTTATATLLNRAGLAGIRSVDTVHPVVVELDQWGGMQNFVNNYGTDPTPWVPDTGVNKVYYSAHYYQDSDHSGTYAGANATWAVAYRDRLSGNVTPMLSWGQTRALPIFLGEFGVLNDTSTSAAEWRTDLNTLLGLFDQYGAHATYWAGGPAYTSATSLTPSSTNGVANYTAPAKPPTAVMLAHLGVPSASGGMLPVDGKGALIVGTAFGAVDSLAVGAAGTVLTADAAQPMGVRWSAPTGGGGSTGTLKYPHPLAVNGQSSALVVLGGNALPYTPPAGKVLYITFLAQDDGTNFVLADGVKISHGFLGHGGANFSLPAPVLVSASQALTVTAGSAALHRLWGFLVDAIATIEPLHVGVTSTVTYTVPASKQLVITTMTAADTLTKATINGLSSGDKWPLAQMEPIILPAGAVISSTTVNQVGIHGYLRPVPA
ncbi:glycoside hydrolase family 5 protein [Nocardioides sp.]|uniref:glycoside hydrolase family 5 protein n=1 Tax=Nocardioides sp. TaxID=35761 RepID=UPI002BF7944D|nr:cellulase family glycosylhydrolase [Nocardioides sp.]HXH79497.1 cellulase family glycosylhydrolase [Nocardioides sp.]